MQIGDLKYESFDRVASITLNRPEKFNAITERMPDDLADAVTRANDDDAIHVIVLTGAGRGFCGGYDLNVFAEGKTQAIQEMPWDAMIDYQFMRRCTERFMSLWRSPKPVIAKINGDAVAGGSDMRSVVTSSSWMRTLGLVIRQQGSGDALRLLCGFTGLVLSVPRECF